MIGAGLTAVDGATEALAYYPVQVLKFKRRYDQVLHQKAEEAAKNTDLDAEVSKEFLEHAEILQRELDLCERRGASLQIFTLIFKSGRSYDFLSWEIKSIPKLQIKSTDREKGLR